MSLDMYSISLSDLVVDDRFDAVLFRAPHPSGRELADWQPFVWREPIVGWAKLKCTEVWEIDGDEQTETTESLCGVIPGEMGELRPLRECDDILDAYLLFVLPRGEALTESAVVTAARDAMRAQDPRLIECASGARARRENHEDMS